MSTSMPTKLPEASVYSKGLKTVSVAMTHFLPVVSAEAASEEAESAGAAAVEDAVEAAPPQAARDRAITEAIPNANSFFMVTFLSTPQISRRRAAGRGRYQKRAIAPLFPCAIALDSSCFIVLLIIAHSAKKSIPKIGYSFIILSLHMVSAVFL